MIGTGIDRRSRPSTNTVRRTISTNRDLILGTDMVDPTFSRLVAINPTTDHFPDHLPDPRPVLQDTQTRGLASATAAATSIDTVLKKVADTITTNLHHIGQVQAVGTSIPVTTDIDHKDHTLHHIAHSQIQTITVLPGPSLITTVPPDPSLIMIDPHDLSFPNPTTIARHPHDPITTYHNQSYQSHHHTSLQTTIALTLHIAHT